MNRLIIGQVTVEDSNLIGDVDYFHTVNPSERMGIGFAVSACIRFQTLQAVSRGASIIYYTQQPSDSDWRKIGVFYADEAVQIGNTYAVTAYDAMYLTDKDPAPVQGAKLLSWLFSDTVESCGLDVSPTMQGAVGITVWPPDYTNLHSCRKLLGYLAQLAGGYAFADPDGKIGIRVLTTQTYREISAAEYTSIRLSGTVEPPDGIRYQSGAGIKQIYTTTKKNRIDVPYNPLLMSCPNDTADDFMSNVLSQLRARIGQYAVGRIALLEDYGINAGDCLLVDGKKFIVFSKNMGEGGVVLRATYSEADADRADAEAMQGDKAPAVHLLDSTPYKWGEEYRFGRVSPSIALPTPTNRRPEEMTVCFQGTGANYTITAPAGCKVTASSFAGLSDGNTISAPSVSNAYYWIKFKVISAGRIIVDMKYYQS